MKQRLASDHRALDDAPLPRASGGAAPFSPRTVAAIVAAKGAAKLIQRLGWGGGTAAPGLVALRLDRQVITRLAGQLGLGAVLITGTNGKTTTARMVSRLAQATGWRAIGNRSGSNLMRGIAATLVAASDFAGRLPNGSRCLGIFEVDEATLPEAVAALRPAVVIFTNLFRDQLDRYGEVDSVAAQWQQAVSALPATSVVVLNADDPSVAALADHCPGQILYYGIEDTTWALEQPEHAADARWCWRCGAEYAYAANFYGHLGHWRCLGCGQSRPVPQIAAWRPQSQASSTTLTLATPRGEASITLPLQGLYNVYNALAAMAVAYALGLGLQPAAAALASFTAAFGRQERLTVRGREVQILLGKNPAGFNQLLRTLAADGVPDKRLLLILNDGIADGRDVSWIWDVDFELLQGQAGLLMTAGTRAEDLALRLKYADLAVATVEPDIRRALDLALAQTPPGERLYVLPTYTALLTARQMLARWGGQVPFWEEG